MTEDRTYVPDGDPCRKAGHGGQRTVLIHIPGAGLFSQCPACVEAFLDWYGGPTQQRAAVADLPPRGEGVKRPRAASLQLAL